MNNLSEYNRRKTLFGVSLIASVILLQMILSVREASAQVDDLFCDPSIQFESGDGTVTVRAKRGTGNYSWSAPEGSPSTGVGSTFTTKYPKAEIYEITLSDDGGDSAICIIAISSITRPTRTPTATPLFSGTPSPDNRPAPPDFGLREYDIISSFDFNNDFDVYSINRFGFKRLFTTPAMFRSYGHLGFDKIKHVDVNTRNSFETSGILQSCEAQTRTYWGLEVVTEDTAVLHPLNISIDDALNEDFEFFRKIFCINNIEENMYFIGEPYTSLSQIPNYFRSEN